ncbi:MAG TPA: family 10 glycosylhydrolase, partial [Gemmatimonadaceae bacterium]
MRLPRPSFLCAAAAVVCLAAPLAAPAAQSTTSHVAPPGSSEAPPPVAREFRAAWVATVGNIDWPSRPGLSTWEQQQELLAILNRAVALHLNAIFLQVRPGTDALYDSRLEPWSEYLTGRMGRPPEPAWDPLAFAVAQAHARGLELHAWVNPYRAGYAKPI